LCKYGNLKDELIRDRLVSGIKDDRVHEKLLSKKDLTLQKAIKILRTSQVSQFQSRDMAAEQDVTFKTIKRDSKATGDGNSPTEASQTSNSTSGGHWARSNLTKSTRPCRYCGNRHEFKKEACPAFGKECHKCGKKGHFSIQCRSTTKNVYSLDDNCSDEEDLFFISSVKMTSSRPVVATCTVNQKHQVVFKLDTGASCNILPLEDYMKATGDKLGQHIQKTAIHLTMHNNTSEKPVGKEILLVGRSGHNHQLCFYIIQSKAMPILGKDAYIGMQLIKILDCDTIHNVTETEISADAKKTLNNCFKGLQ